jgi:hypothetical protein
MTTASQPGALAPGADRELGPRARAAGVIVWSAFLSSAIATMLCFALVDPQALAEGDAPAWWTSRLRVYAIGFFFFWLVGLTAAALCWYLARGPRP